MLEYEDIAGYMLQVDEIFNVINDHGGKMDEINIVKKVLRTLPKDYNVKFLLLRKLKIWISFLQIKGLVL